MAEKKTWHIRDIDTRESVHSIEVDANMDDRKEERLLRAVLINMDRDRFYVDTDDNEEETK